jgi:hypothetical protein
MAMSYEDQITLEGKAVSTIRARLDELPDEMHERVMRWVREDYRRDAKKREAANRRAVSVSSNE